MEKVYNSRVNLITVRIPLGATKVKNEASLKKKKKKKRTVKVNGENFQTVKSSEKYDKFPDRESQWFK